MTLNSRFKEAHYKNLNRELVEEVKSQKRIIQLLKTENFELQRQFLDERAQRKLEIKAAVRLFLDSLGMTGDAPPAATPSPTTRRRSSVLANELSRRSQSMSLSTSSRRSSKVRSSLEMAASPVDDTETKTITPPPRRTVDFTDEDTESPQEPLQRNMFSIVEEPTESEEIENVSDTIVVSSSSPSPKVLCDVTNCVTVRRGKQLRSKPPAPAAPEEVKDESLQLPRFSSRSTSAKLWCIEQSSTILSPPRQSNFNVLIPLTSTPELSTSTGSEVTQQEPTLSGRPRRRCSPSVLKEPALGSKMRNDTSKRKSKSKRN